MSNPKKPKPGDLRIDASDITVTRLTSAEILRLTQPHDGHTKAVDDLAELKPEDLERAGVYPEEIERLLALQDEDDRIGEVLPAAEKLVALLTQTRLLRRHEIAAILSEIAAQVQLQAASADSSAEVLEPFTSLLEYQYGPVIKIQSIRARAKPLRELPARRQIA